MSGVKNGRLRLAVFKARRISPAWISCSDPGFALLSSGEEPCPLSPARAFHPPAFA